MKLLIVLLAVDAFDRRQHAEFLENTTFEDVKSIYKSLQKNLEDEITDADVLIYEPAEFMDACNNEEIELTLWWVSYVYVKN